MPVYETQAELDAAEADSRRRHAIERACKATGKPCEHVGNHHVESAHRRGLHLRAANGMFYSGVRYVAVNGCRWCGLPERMHCGGAPTPRGLHTYEPPTSTQWTARERVFGLDRDGLRSAPTAEPEVGPSCQCDTSDEDAEPCDAWDCSITELMEIGFPG